MIYYVKQNNYYDYFLTGKLKYLHKHMFTITNYIINKLQNITICNVVEHVDCSVTFSLLEFFEIFILHISLVLSDLCSIYKCNKKKKQILSTISLI